MRSALVLSLALVPPLVAVVWTWVQIRKADKQLGSVANFEAMHFEK